MQLALVGSMATDDPEGWEFFHADLRATRTATPTSRSSTTSTTSARSRSTPSSRRPTWCMQKSIREGFGLTVTEALWKGRPTIGGNVGGIPLQIVDGETGFLVSSPEEAAQRTLEILEDPELGQAPRPGRQGARPRALPHPAPAARLAADLRRPRGLAGAAARRGYPGSDARRAPLIDRLQPRPRRVRARRGRRADASSAAAAAWSRR